MSEAAEVDARTLYVALENILGDLYLLGLGEITISDIGSGSQREGLNLLVSLQRYRKDCVLKDCHCED